MSDSDLPPDTVVIKIRAFSVNYADCCIRWGLYESANKFVGWPIVPGFDIAGVIERVSTAPSSNNVGSSTNKIFQVGDRVYGATFFGAYSTRCLVPSRQLRKIPPCLSFSDAASLPAVSMTALYSLYLGGRFPPQDCVPRNKSILVHSAAGGVGTMLVQFSKLLGLSPVVGVVGRTSKVDHAVSLGCDHVIDKSVLRTRNDLWMAAKEAAASEEGYAIITDANGVSTLESSFDHLAPTGRLIIFGFHSNLPMGQDMLHPMEWVRMIFKMTKMPKFDAMDLVVSNKSLLGFNLSFFVKEVDMLSKIYDQIDQWLREGRLQIPRITAMPMKDIGDAHILLQSGKSVGKIVMTT
jgi:NADPH:quinone reductase-like Zn-dependent oxidoreductase